MTKKRSALSRLGLMELPIISSGVSKRVAAISVLKAIETGKLDAIEQHVHPELIQHNLGIASGRDALIAMVDAAMYSDVRIEIIRSIEDHEYVVVHNVVHMDGKAQAVMDVFRFAGGKIVEHWDNSETIQNAMSGGSMVCGPTEIEDHALTQSNLRQFARYLDVVLEDEISDDQLAFFDKDFVQHSPLKNDGIEEMIKFRRSSIEAKIWNGKRKAYMIIGEGNMIFFMSSGIVNEQEFAMFEIFRMKDELICERWVVGAPVLEPSDRKNDNSKF
jgi:predicted SnoaL-like aldol condensation-catalyzing enzyme